MLTIGRYPLLTICIFGLLSINGCNNSESNTLDVSGIKAERQAHVKTITRSEVQRFPPSGEHLVLVEITGENFQWHIRYPGQDGLLGTVDDVTGQGNLELPAETQVRIDLKSEDYIYSLALPKWGLKEIAVPNMTFSLQFNTGPEGTYDLLGDQMCGYAHPTLLGKLHVISRSGGHAL